MNIFFAIYLLSNNPLTLQNPDGLIGNPSSRIKNEPHAPGPVRIGDLIAVKCSWPDPRLIHVPDNLLNICFGC